MRTIITKYLGDTSQIEASDCDGNSIKIYYPHTSRKPHLEAVRHLFSKMGWAPCQVVEGRLGQAKYAWTVIDEDYTFNVEIGRAHV